MPALDVKSRLLVDPLDEQIGLFSLPCLQCLNGVVSGN